MADTPITWHPHTKDDPLTRLGQGTDTDISIMNSTMVTPPSRLRRKHRSMLSNPRNPEAVKEVLVMAFVTDCQMIFDHDIGGSGIKKTAESTSIDSQWPLKSMLVPKWRITIRAGSQRSASSVVDLSEDRNAEYKQHQLHIYGRRVV
ncbi:hypothetical protein ACO22_00668 [Paracoccidioides brasiliensis]|uniref:Uncharacterized protein n=1 Tax=Paracoccidioides brasiliensis TaxID=121759 RepID=A0A1D2JNP4_PARBR|nr:hypothetical protein ACO22_00668 [Paracoccidioides brasiliensis]